MEEYTRVSVVSDDDGHWYVIPFELVEEFDMLLSGSQYDSCDGWEENEAEFIEKFSQYMTGGDINNVELYIKSK